MDRKALVELTTDIVTAQVANNSTTTSELPALVGIVRKALESLGSPVVVIRAEKVPAVPVRSSVKPDSLTCLECGKKQRMLRRHLDAAHGMTPVEYRAAYKLPGSYPMTAPAMAEKKRELAAATGFGKTIAARGAGAKDRAGAKAPRKA